MGRKPIGKVAMTDAERQRKRRERLAPAAPKAYLTRGLPWDESATPVDWPRIKLFDQWMTCGDTQKVAQWLAFRVDSDRWEEIDRLVRAEHRAEEGKCRDADNVTTGRGVAHGAVSDHDMAHVIAATDRGLAAKVLAGEMDIGVAYRLVTRRPDEEGAPTGEGLCDGSYVTK
jgi:hypothetical protein